MTGSHDLSVLATDDSEIVVDSGGVGVGVGGGSVGVGIGFGLSYAENRISTTTTAQVGRSSIDVGDDLYVRASTISDIDAFALGGGVGVGVGYVGVAVALGAAIAINRVDNVTIATIFDMDFLSGEHAIANGDIEVTSTTNAMIDSDVNGAAISVSGGFAGASVSMGMAIAANDLAYQTIAEVTDVDVLTASTGRAWVLADSLSQIRAKALAASVSVAISIGGAAAAAGAVMINGPGEVIDRFIDLANNSSTGQDGNTSDDIDSAATGVTVEAGTSTIARIVNVTSASAGTNVKVTATDNAVINASADSAAIAGGLGSFGIALTVSLNIIDNYTGAYIQNSDVDADGGSLEILGTSTQTIISLADAMSFSAGAVGLSMAGVYARTAVIGTVEAFARSADLEASGIVRIKALTTLTADTDTDVTSITAAMGPAFGMAYVTSEVFGRTSAFADGTVDITASDLEVIADGTHKALADVQSIAVGFAGGVVLVGASSEVGRVTEAFVGTRVGQARTATVLNIGTGEVLIKADSESLADTEIFGGAASLGLSLNVLLGEAKVSSKTRAYLGEGPTLTAGELDVVAISDDDAVADAIALAAGFIAGNGVVARSSITGSTEAFIGAPAGATPGASPTTTVNISIPGVWSGVAADPDGTVEVSATTDAYATGTPSAVGGGILAAVNLLFSDIDVSSRTSAFVGEGVSLTARALTVVADGTRLEADSQVLSVALAGFVGGTGIKSDANVDGVVEAYIGAREDGAAHGVATTINVGSGALLVDADALITATSDAYGVTVGGAIAGTILLAKAIADGEVLAYIRDGVAVTAGSLGVHAGNPATADPVVMTATSQTFAGGLSMGVAANGILADAAVAGLVAAWIGSPVGTNPTGGATQTISIVGGDVDVTALANMTATATPFALAGGIAAAVTLLLPTATVAGTVRAYVGEGIDLQATNLNVLALAPIMKATATGNALGISGFVTVNVIKADAEVGGYDLDGDMTDDQFAVVEAFIGEQSTFVAGPSTSVDVGMGDVFVLADATITANATASGIGASFVGAINAMLPSATAGGRVAAYVRDRVDVTAGDLYVRAGGDPTDRTIAARVDVAATAISDTITIGLLAGTGVESHALTVAVVEAFVGSPAALAASSGTDTITLTGDAVVTAWSNLDAVADIDATSVAGISVNIFFPSADANGTTRAYIGQALTLSATAVTLHADGDYNAESDIDITGIDLVGVTVVDVDTTVTGVVDAHVGSAAGTTPVSAVADLDLIGDLDIDADAVMTVSPSITEFGLSLFSVSVLYPSAWLQGAVRAYIGEGVDVDAANIHIEASAPSLSAVAEATNLKISLVSASVFNVEAKVSTQVEAFIGAHRTIGATDVTTDVDVNGGSIEILVDTAMTATATADTFGFALVEVNVMLPTATVDGYAGTYVRDGVNLDANELLLATGPSAGDATKRVLMKATSTTVGVGFSAIGVDVLVAEAHTDGSVESFIGAPSGILAGGDSNAVLDINGTLSITARSDIQAIASASAGGADGISIAYLAPLAYADATTRAYAGDGTNTFASGVTIVADGTRDLNRDHAEHRGGAGRRRRAAAGGEPPRGDRSVHR